MVERCSSTQEGKKRDHHSPRIGPPRPGAKAQELFAPAVLLDGHERARGPQPPTANLQVPAVVVSSPERDSARILEGSLDGRQPRIGCAPELAPDGGRSLAGQREDRRGALLPPRA